MVTKRKYIKWKKRLFWKLVVVGEVEKKKDFFRKDDKKTVNEKGGK